MNVGRSHDAPGGATEVRVLIADDHEAIRAGVRAALETGGLHVVAEAATAADAVRLAGVERPDVCLLDIDMPGNGIAACRAIRSAAPSAVVVMLTVSSHDDDLFDALQAGASGYLLKTGDPVRLPAAVRGVVAGEAAIPRELVARMVGEFRNRRGRRRLLRGGRAERLSDREWEVLELMAEGKSTREISDRLFVSQVTVRSHVQAIIRKLEVPDRAAVMALVREASELS